MESSGLKLKIWTEGLGEFWGIAPDHKERRQRDDMSAVEVAAIIHNILEENGHAANGLFVLQHGEIRLNLNLSNGVIEISDPRNANYQNVAMAESELVPYLEKFFVREVNEEKEVLRTPLVQKLEYLVAVIVVVALGLTIRFVIHYLDDTSQFMPEPQTSEIADSKEVRQLTVQYAGIYATKIREGEMIIELKENGTWAHYDVQQGSLGSFILNPVNEGTFRPVYDAGRIAILTNTRYLFYPGNQQDEIVFLERPFKKIGATRDDLPYVTFPDKAEG